MLDWAIYREQFKYNLKAGTKYELPVYDPSLSPDRTMPTTVEILGPEVVDLFGRKVEAVKTRQTLRLSGAGGGTDLDTLGWVTKAGAPVRLQMKIMDIPIELLACQKTVAMAEDDPAELMVNMLVPLNRPINAEQARKLTYKVGLKKGAKGKLPDFPETTIQKVITKSENEITLQITRPSALPKNKVKADLTSEQRREYLAATATVNYKDPEVAKLAKQATGKEKDPRQMAENLCRYVSDHIQSKTLGVGFATASEVARSREGDCTEHGVLLAALGRAKGIPTRLVTGLVHADNFGGKANVLAGHLWTQFWIDGEWVDLDAALRQTDVDPTHIAMAITSAGDSGIADLVTSTWLNLGQFEMTVTESK